MENSFTKAAENSLIASALTKKGRFGGSDTVKYKFFMPLKRNTAKAFENSLILNFFKSLTGKISSMPIKNVGIIYFVFGVFTAIYRGTSYFSENVLTISALMPEIICIALSGMIIASRSSFSEAAANSRLTGLIFTDIGGINFAVPETQTAGAGFIPVLIGLALGLAGIPLGFYTAAMLPIILTVAVMVLNRPESGLPLFILAIPFAGETVLSAASVFIFISLILKVIRGKRSIRIGLPLVCCSALAFLALLRGDFVYFSFFLTAVSALTLVPSSAWVERNLLSLLCSSVIISVCGICGIAAGYVSDDFLGSALNMISSLTVCHSTFFFSSMIASALLFRKFVLAGNTDGKIINGCSCLIFLLVTFRINAVFGIALIAVFALFVLLDGRAVSGFILLMLIALLCALTVPLEIAPGENLSSMIPPEYSLIGCPDEISAGLGIGEDSDIITKSLIHTGIFGIVIKLITLLTASVPALTVCGKSSPTALLSPLFILSMITSALTNVPVSAKTAAISIVILALLFASTDNTRKSIPDGYNEFSSEV